MSRWFKTVLCAILATALLVLSAGAADRIHYAIGPRAELWGDYVVRWQDPAVEQMIRMGLDRPGGPIRRSELDHVHTVYIAGSSHCLINQGGSIANSNWGTNSYTIEGETYTEHGKITSLEDFVHFENLTTLKVLFNSLEDLSSVEGLHRVRELNAGLNYITDLSGVAGLTGLETLSVWGNRITDIEPLAGLTGLENLYISENQISDPRPLAGLWRLADLNITSNNLSSEDLEWLQMQLPDCSFR